MHQRGFTLIELLVSVTIFTVVMTMALGSLLSITAAERKAETLKAVINNLHFALDSMSRAVRTGVDYNCGSASGGDCAAGSTSFYFTDSQGRSVSYCRGDGSACSSTGTSVLQSIAGSAYAPITSPEVTITAFSFYLIGSVRGDSMQPRVTLTLSGYAKMNENTEQNSTFNIQTTVTQRLYDL